MSLEFVTICILEYSNFQQDELVCSIFQNDSSVNVDPYFETETKIVAPIMKENKVFK